MPSTEEEWDKHFQSLTSDNLLDLLASPSLVHRDTVMRILLDRGFDKKDIHEGMRARVEQIVQESKTRKQINFWDREKYFTFYILIISVAFGVISIPFLIWYDWIVLAEKMKEGELGNFLFLAFLAAVFGFPAANSTSWVNYKVAPDAGVIGFPFPGAVTEPVWEHSEGWIDFTFPLGLFLNLIFWFLASLAVLLWLNG